MQHETQGSFATRIAQTGAKPGMTRGRTGSVYVNWSADSIFRLRICVISPCAHTRGEGRPLSLEAHSRLRGADTS